MRCKCDFTATGIIQLHIRVESAATSISHRNDCPIALARIKGVDIDVASGDHTEFRNTRLQRSAFALCISDLGAGDSDEAQLVWSCVAKAVTGFDGVCAS